MKKRKIVSKSVAMFIIIAVAIEILIAHAYAQERRDYSEIDAYQYIYDKTEINRRLKTYLIGDPAVFSFIKLDNDKFSLYASAEDKRRGLSEYELMLTDTLSTKEPLLRPNLLRAVIKSLPLEGKTIVLDPGHIGGEYAEIEARNAKIASYVNRKRVVYTVREGDIAYFTALNLRKMLIESGAEVVMTREQGMPAYSKPFKEWLTDGFEATLEDLANDLPESAREATKLKYKKSSAGKKFEELYLREEFRARAKIIDDVDPDFTLSIHYNKCNGVSVGVGPTVSNNYALSFVAGSFMGSEMQRADNRMSFLNLLVKDHIMKSIPFGYYMNEAFNQILGIPVMKSFAGDVLNLDGGVYARNVSILRNSDSPIVLGEPLCVDNKDEVLKLNTEVASVDSERIKEVAFAYYSAIVKALVLPKNE